MYSSGNSTECSVMTCTGKKNLKRVNICICVLIHFTVHLKLTALKINYTSIKIRKKVLLVHLNVIYSTKMKVTHRHLGLISVDGKVYLLCEDSRQWQPLHLVAWRGRASRHFFS